MNTEKYLLVTGCKSPLGVSICETFQKEGYYVIGTDISRTFDGSNVNLYLPADLANAVEVENLAKTIDSEFPSLDGIVNNAAITGDAALRDSGAELSNQSYESFLLTLKVNLLAPFVLSRDLAAKLRGSGRGSIVNISSIYGLVGNTREIYEGGHIPTSAAYSASKGGLIQLTRYMSTYLAPKVRVNAVAPGGILRIQNEVFKERYSAIVPLGRMAKESDISAVVSFLISSRSEYITGQVIAVDGGWTTR